MPRQRTTASRLTLWCRKSGADWLLRMGLCTSLTRDTWAIAATITAWLLAWRLIILLTSKPGPRQRLAVEFGDMAALPVVARTCSSSQVTPLTQVATGWAAKQSSACKPGRFGPVSQPNTGRRLIG